MGQIIYSLSIARKATFLEAMHASGCTVSNRASQQPDTLEQWEGTLDGQSFALYFFKVGSEEALLFSVFVNKSVPWTRRGKFLKAVLQLLEKCGAKKATLAEIEREALFWEKTNKK
jgi:hypothetical protein